MPNLAPVFPRSGGRLALFGQAIGVSDGGRFANRHRLAEAGGLVGLPRPGERQGHADAGQEHADERQQPDDADRGGASRIGQAGTAVS